MVEDFNDSQKEAITLTSDVKEVSDILVVAGAGSGKTKVLIHRIAYLVENKGVDPKSILGVTFTKKASNEMQDRLKALLKNRVKIKLGTFHALAADLLRTFLETEFEIIDDNDQSRMLRSIIKETESDDNITLKEFKKWHSNQRNAYKDPGLELPSDSDKISVYRDMSRKYKKQKNSIGSGVFDFDDLIEQLILLLQRDAKVKSYLHKRWRYILVDEYQDTNNAQFLLIELIRGKNTQLLQVGDEDQLIYSWRGADIDNIMSSYERSLKNEKVKCVMLNVNYRCSGNILALANSVISDNNIRTGKKLVANKESGKPVSVIYFDSSSEESEHIAHQMDRWLSDDVNYKDMGVLVRTNRMVKPLERAFIQAQIPYKIFNGTTLFESKEVRLLLALLKFTEDPSETFYFQIITDIIKMGIGPAKLLKLDELRIEAGLNWIDYLKSDEKLFANQRIKELLMFYPDARECLDDGCIADAAKGWMYNWELMSFFKSEEREKKTENTLVFFSVLEDYEHDATVRSHKVTVADFQEQRLLNDTLIDGDDSDAVQIMTVHKAKGLEFKKGVVVGMQDGVFPMGNSDFFDNEEDWRLAYVSITRFMDELLLTRAGYRVGFNDISSRSQIIDPHMEKLKKEGRLVYESY